MTLEEVILPTRGWEPSVPCWLDEGPQSPKWGDFAQYRTKVE